MATGTNGRTPSTTSVWETGRVRRRPKGQQGSTPRASRWGRRAKVNPRDRLTLTIHFRGGAECWYEVQARGEVGRFHGATAIHDVCREIMLGVEWYGREVESDRSGFTTEAVEPD